MRRNYFIMLFLLAGLTVCGQSGSVTIQVDAKKEIGEMKPIWAWFG